MQKDTMKNSVEEHDAYLLLGASPQPFPRNYRKGFFLMSFFLNIKFVLIVTCAQRKYITSK